MMIDLTAWQWFFVTGLGLVLFEFLIAEFFLLWIGFSCILTALTIFLGGFGVLGQICAFTLFSIITLTIGYLRYERKSAKWVTDGLNDRLNELIGYTWVLDAPVSLRKGSGDKAFVSINDTRWFVLSDYEIAAGQEVRVVRMDGNTLIIEVTMP